MSAQVAAQILKLAKDNGFSVEVRGTIFTITKAFPKGNCGEYVNCESVGFRLFDLLPRTSPGSDWGSDSGSIGGQIAIDRGVFVMNRSGGSKRILNALRKIL